MARNTKKGEKGRTPLLEKLICFEATESNKAKIDIAKNELLFCAAISAHWKRDSRSQPVYAAEVIKLPYVTAPVLSEICCFRCSLTLKERRAVLSSLRISSYVYLEDEQTKVFDLSGRKAGASARAHDSNGHFVSKREQIKLRIQTAYQDLSDAMSEWMDCSVAGLNNNGQS